MATQSFRDSIRSRISLRPIVSEDPRLLSNARKNLIMFGVCGGVSLPGIASTIYFPGIPSIINDLHASDIAITLTTALFVLATGIAPVLWASLSDRYQVRRILFFISLFIFAAASIVSALISNIWALVVFRILQAFGCSCCFCNGSGIISDIYPVEQRGSAFSKFYFAFFFGPLIGPILGGVLVLSSLSWRATFWFCFGLSISLMIYIFIFVPETYRIEERFKDITNGNGAKNEKTLEKSDATLIESNSKKQSPSNPLKVFLLLRHPFLLLPSLISGITFGCMFAVETIIPELFEKKYNFNSWEIGLSYLGCGIGNVLGAIFGGLVSDKLLLRSRKLRGGDELVEDRITLNIWPCAFILVPLGLLLFGWSIESKFNVFVPIVAFGIQSFGLNQIMASISAYIVETIPGQGASTSAAEGFLRQSTAFVLTLVANPLANTIGPGMTCTILAICSAIQCIIMLIIKFKGEKLRKWSGY